MLLVDRYGLGVKASGRVWLTNTSDGAKGKVVLCYCKQRSYSDIAVLHRLVYGRKKKF